MTDQSGQIDITHLEASDNPEDRARAAKLLTMDQAIRRHMSPEGSLGLPELLDKRRLEFGIPDDAFRAQAAFERIYIWQLATEVETYGRNSRIVIPDEYASKRRDSTPRGVVLSAGLRALDVLRSNGMDVGHIVRFIRYTPFKMTLAIIDGLHFDVLVMNVGDITGSEDLRDKLRSGLLEVTGKVDEEGVRRHTITITKAGGQSELSSGVGGKPVDARISVE